MESLIRKIKHLLREDGHILSAEATDELRQLIKDSFDIKL